MSTAAPAPAAKASPAPAKVKRRVAAPDQIIDEKSAIVRLDRLRKLINGLTIVIAVLTLALVWYFVERHGEERPFDLGEVLALGLAFAMPFFMLELKKVGMPMSWAPLGLMFCLIAWPRAAEGMGAAAPSPTLPRTGGGD